MDHGKSLTSTDTAIPGLVVIDLPVPGDGRGWFKENWQREKLRALGLPDLTPVQNNVSFNDAPGTTRGIHAEPWNKYVSVASGRIFGAWVDLREGPTFGTLVTIELDPSRAVLVPRGVGNSYQTLEPDTAYVYLVDDHWYPDAQYTFLNLADETVAVPWPIPLEEAEVSTKDRSHPLLAEVMPIRPKRTLVLGANGQVGRALRERFPDAEFVDRSAFDLTDPGVWGARRWRDYAVVINAAAFTDVDGAETADGRRTAWAVNAGAIARLAAVANEYDLTIVHISSDYVFDGTAEAHTEDELVSPLGVYGQTKAAGDALVSTVARQYTLRTSWVVGEGNNFVDTMAALAERGAAPAVVDDQVGRLTFASQIAAAVAHLLATGSPFGTYNVSSSGEPTTWADIARRVFVQLGRDPADVTGQTTADYQQDRPGAPRPRRSVLDLAKIEATGFVPGEQWAQLHTHLAARDGRDFAD